MIDQRSTPAAIPWDRRVFIGVLVLSALSLGAAEIYATGGLNCTIPWRGATGAI
jgi:hypothetical protein